MIHATSFSLLSLHTTKNFHICKTFFCLFIQVYVYIYIYFTYTYVTNLLCKINHIHSTHEKESQQNNLLKEVTSTADILTIVIDKSAPCTVNTQYGTTEVQGLVLITEDYLLILSILHF